MDINKLNVFITDADFKQFNILNPVKFYCFLYDLIKYDIDMVTSLRNWQAGQCCRDGSRII